MTADPEQRDEPHRGRHVHVKPLRYRRINPYASENGTLSSTSSASRADPNVMKSSAKVIPEQPLQESSRLGRAVEGWLEVGEMQAVSSVRRMIQSARARLPDRRESLLRRLHGSLMAASDLCWLPALDLAALVRQKKVSPVEVTDAALAQIERVNPTLNAYCAVTAAEARDAAQAAEVAVMTGEELGPLHGVPVSVQDLVFMRRGPTTGGSRIFADHVPEEDAVAVERLKGAGAIILGKTNTPEFGHKGVTDNPLFGITRNPWNPAMTPGGSSGGAGAAVAAGMGPLALGTDGGGSIRIPASFCGIYGLKPSFGRVPHGPGFPGWQNFSVTGPMTRTVRDAALMLDALAGPDDRDRWSLPADGGPPFLAACEGGLEGLSIGWSADFGYARVDPEVAELCGAAAEQFEGLGCHVEVVTPSWENPEEIFRTMSAGER